MIQAHFRHLAGFLNQFKIHLLISVIPPSHISTESVDLFGQFPPKNRLKMKHLAALQSQHDALKWPPQ